MIGRLQGVLLEKNAPQLLLDVNGVGYEVDAPMSTFYQLPETGQKVVLHTHLHVREDSQTLFGFASLAERSLFRSLIKISGVGARLALTILSGIRPDEFFLHVQNQDSSALTRLPGIGKKTAERLIVEMRDKLKELEPALQTAPGAGEAMPASALGDSLREATSALIALGYKAPEASRMVQAVENKSELSAEEIIRKALQSVQVNA